MLRLDNGLVARARRGSYMATDTHQFVAFQLAPAPIDLGGAGDGSSGVKASAMVGHLP